MSELRLVYIDDSLAVVDKPAGLVVHPAPSHQGPTLVDELGEIRAAAATPSARASSTGSTRAPAG
jgi:23S rRNA-/tRNA-specific pseudouridylate synthase